MKYPVQRILIISNGPLCRNPRVLKEARTLAEAGYTVKVLTVRNHVPSEIHDRALMESARFQRVTVDMIPNTGSAHISVFGRRLLLWTARKLACFKITRSIHSLGPARSLLNSARHHPADLTIVHNEIAHWVGIRLLAEGRRVAADIEDWHSEDLLPADRGRRPLALLRQIERTLLHQAAYTTTTSQALADALHSRYGGKAPVPISNSFPLATERAAAKAKQDVAFFWFSQTLGPGRGIEAFIAAWSRMRQPARLVLLGEDVGGFADRLRQSVPASRRDALEFHPLVAPDELPPVIARHDVGLALELEDIPNRDLTITNKILQYLNAGLAVVATNTQGQREVLSHGPDAGILVSLDNPEVLAARLDALVADHAMLAMRQKAARQLAQQRYCWEYETPRLCHLIQSALTRPLGPSL